MENLVIFAVCAAIFGATAMGIYFATMKRRTGVQVTLWTLLGLIVAWLVFMLATATGCRSRCRRRSSTTRSDRRFALDLLQYPRTGAST